jgi:hypothetical protein
MPYQGGLFSPPSSIGIGDPYIDPSKSKALTAHGASKGLRQFGISRGIPGSFNRLYEGEKHIDNAKVLSAQRIKGRQQFLTPNGFRHASGSKESACAGDYNGTFQGKAFPHVADGTALPRGTTREAIRQIGPKNILTQPPKKAVGSQGATPKILFTETEYVASAYDLADQKEKVAIFLLALILDCNILQQELKKTQREKTEGRPAFKVSVEHTLSKPMEESVRFAQLFISQSGAHFLLRSLGIICIEIKCHIAHLTHFQAIAHKERWQLNRWRRNDPSLQTCQSAQDRGSPLWNI